MKKGVVPLLFLCYNTFNKLILMSRRGKEIVKLLEKVIKQEHLYTDEELKDLKSQLRVVKEELTNIDNALSKGFGK